MISKISFENFQGFKGEQSVRLAPITLIFGANSSGKSSIARAINFLISSQASKRSDATSSRGSAKPNYQGLLFGQNGKTMESSWLGVSATVVNNSKAFGFSEVTKGIHVDVLTDEVSILYGAALTEEAFQNTVEKARVSRIADQARLSDIVIDIMAQEITDPAKWIERAEEAGLSLEDYTLQWQSFRGAIGANIAALRDFTPGPQLQRSFQFHYSSFQGFKIEKESLEVISGEINFPGEQVEDESTQQAKVDSWVPSESSWEIVDGSVLVEDEPGGDYDWLERDGLERRIIDTVNTVNQLLGAELSFFRFVDPIRSAPGQFSQNAGETKIPTETMVSMNAALMGMTGNRYSYEIREMEALPFSKVQANLVRDHFTDTVLNFEDVGSGLSQILPILQSIFANTPGAVYIEQPELHLHPKMQADFMDIFINEFLREEKASGNQFIIETHSESMLLRLQKRIREGVLSPEDVCILFTDVAQESAEDSVISRFNTVSEIKLDHLGDVIDPLPISFVNLRIEDLL